jgi:hypothetical protein
VTGDPDRNEQSERELLKRVVWPSHEPLAFLRRRGGLKRDHAAEYEAYHQAANVRLWRKLLGPKGTHILHFFKGLGLKFERGEMDRALPVARMMHEDGLLVSLYIGGTMHTETFYLEEPQARAWACVGQDGSPVTYMDYQLWRHFACINNPDYRAYMRRVIDVALGEFEADWLWFDNNILRAEPRSCRCKCCREQFVKHVMGKYPSQRRIERYGYEDLSLLSPPEWSGAWPPQKLVEIRDPAIQDWVDFRCQSVYDFFRQMSAHIRSKRPDTIVALNIKGIHPHNLCFDNGIDHGRWDLPLVNSCDAGLQPHLGPRGNLQAEFRSFKISHSTGLSIIDGHSDRGNLLGMVMNRQLATAHGCVPRIGQHMLTFGQLGQFLRQHQDDLYGQRPIIADVAVLRSFASMAYNSANWSGVPFLCEQALWEKHVPFGIIFDANLHDLAGHKVVLLANQDSLSDDALAKLRAFVEGGGGIVATDRTGHFDEWRRQRPVNALAEAFGLRLDKGIQRLALGRGRVAYVPTVEAAHGVEEAEGAAHTGRSSHDDALPPRNWARIEQALRWAAGGAFTFTARSPHGVAIEYRQGPQPQDRAVHLMNFSGKPSAGPTRIEMAADGKTWSLEILAPGRPPGDARILRPTGGRVRWSVGLQGAYVVSIMRPLTPQAPS